MDAVSAVLGSLIASAVATVKHLMRRARSEGRVEGSILTKLDDIAERLMRLEEKIDQIEEIIREHTGLIGTLQGKVEEARA